MSNPLWKPAAPLLGRFIQMEIISAACIAGYWYELARRGTQPWEARPLTGIVFTTLFIVSNALLFRRRRGLATLGFIACWLTMPWAFAPRV